MNPQVPTLTPEQQQGIELILTRTVELLAKSQGWGHTCLACLHFNEAMEVCTYYRDPIRPPARVIVEGCPAWDGTPF